MTRDAERSAERIAEQKGAQAAWEGRPFRSNPFTDETPGLKLAWSQGHNAHRAAMIRHRSARRASSCR